MINNLLMENFLKILVSVSRFNNGEAGKILDEVKESAEGMKIIFENNEPSCVLMTWEKYQEMLEEIEDQYLLGIVDEREKNGSGKTISHEEMLAKLNITQLELDEMEDVEIE